MHIEIFRGFASALFGFQGRAAKPTLFGHRRTLVEDDVWLEHVCVTALTGADWQGKTNASA